MWKTIPTAVLAMTMFASPAQAQQYVAVTLGDTMVVEIEEGIAESIKARAASDWPDDYAMQKYVVDQQVSAVVWLSGWARNPPVDNQTAERIFSKAASDWPDDYTMQKYTIERQVEAYGAMQ